jgi:uncharacterized protein YjbJ (UPF0337 family)
MNEGLKNDMRGTREKCGKGTGDRKREMDGKRYRTGDEK